MSKDVLKLSSDEEISEELTHSRHKSLVGKAGARRSSTKVSETSKAWETRAKKQNREEDEDDILLTKKDIPEIVQTVMEVMISSDSSPPLKEAESEDLPGLLCNV